MSTATKLLALEYIVDKVKSWYALAGGDLQNNDLSKLKITKLLFFTCAATADRDIPGLLNTFDNFVAMPFGHVESDLQDHMGNTSQFSITKTGLSFKEGVDHYEMNPEIANLCPIIDKGIERLQQINFNLVKYTPFELVDLSHRWQSWKTVFALAKRNGKFSMKIPNDMIMVEPKIFL